ncbi:lysozyme inhibitor LprI family protein [Paraburkholderia rhizosphaerae]|uniref:Uncharacterized protein DUF1311 n=1 Tax=Paraburkholderia rhizosphaerae TaxID=480658 RepID=A0A4R8LXT6_9BURK|nr:lysozyme inhibitor LprI family protein [Paraburkholderia rhizosphaerae]TDY53037.1 uncharacterized protein DUF1311 [Paraburkholderia rhizosphaerae]
MQGIKLLTFSLLVGASCSTSGKSIYSGEFDYRKFQPSASYFAGHKAKDVAHLCATGEHASTSDMEQCAHRGFEKADKDLAQQLATTTAVFATADIDAKGDYEPQALPYLKNAESAWEKYRDDTCYAFAYAAGPATARYINFWDCMTSITQARTNELNRLLKNQ